jgi:hypothetical protein
MTILAPIKLIKETVAEKYEVTVSDIESLRRDTAVIIPRHAVIYLSRSLTSASLPMIGREIGNRDHTTIMSALTSFEARLAKDPILQADIQNLRDVLAPQILDIVHIQRASRLVLNRLKGTEDVLRERVDRAFAIITVAADEQPFTVLEELEGVAVRLGKPENRAEAAE